MAELELHDEIVDWMASLDDTEWDRTVVVIDRLATLGSSARMPLSKSLGDGLFELRLKGAEGIARSAEAIDVVMINGYGFPRWKGGPMYMAATP